MSGSSSSPQFHKIPNVTIPLSPLISTPMTMSVIEIHGHTIPPPTSFLEKYSHNLPMFQEIMVRHCSVTKGWKFYSSGSSSPSSHSLSAHPMLTSKDPYISPVNFPSDSTSQELLLSNTLTPHLFLV